MIKYQFSLTLAVENYKYLTSIKSLLEAFFDFYYITQTIEFLLDIIILLNKNFKDKLIISPKGYIMSNLTKIFYLL